MKLRILLAASFAVLVLVAAGCGGGYGGGAAEARTSPTRARRRRQRLLIAQRDARSREPAQPVHAAAGRGRRTSTGRRRGAEFATARAAASAARRAAATCSRRRGRRRRRRCGCTPRSRAASSRGARGSSSRNPGANRSTCDSIASVASPSQRMRHVAVRPRRVLALRRARRVEEARLRRGSRTAWRRARGLPTARVPTRRSRRSVRRGARCLRGGRPRSPTGSGRRAPSRA